MKCDYCDNIVDSNLRVCPHCGANLKQVVVIKKVVTPIKKNEESTTNNKLINYFLYGVIGIGLLLIILIIILRYK